MDFRPNPSVLTEFLDRSFITIIYVDECNKIQGQQGWAKVGVACSATNIFAHLLLRRLQIQVPENQEYLSKLTSRPSDTSAINSLSDRNLYLILFNLKDSLRVFLVSVEIPAELRQGGKLLSTPYWVNLLILLLDDLQDANLLVELSMKKWHVSYGAEQEIIALAPENLKTYILRAFMQARNVELISRNAFTATHRYILPKVRILDPDESLPKRADGTSGPPDTVAVKKVPKKPQPQEEEYKDTDADSICVVKLEQTDWNF